MGPAGSRLDQRDLAERWLLSTRTLERWRWSGDGPSYIKVGARVIYRLEDIEAYEAAQIRNPRASARPSKLGAVDRPEDREAV
jgi:hypothetical protein